MPKSSKGQDHIDALVGANLRSRRVMARMSQSELGAAVGVTFQQIQKYENGRSRIGVARLVMMAEALGAPTSAFFANVGEGPGRARVDPILAVLRDPATRELLETFASIPHPDLRQKIVALSASSAGALRQPEP